MNPERRSSSAAHDNTRSSSQSTESSRSANNHVPSVEGSSYGQNYRGTNQPYLGPRTPPEPKHRYHLQVFALDTQLPADVFASYVALTAAMKDHVLASGEVVGLGQVMPAEN